jgi:hypothetical protein
MIPVWAVPDCPGGAFLVPLIWGTGALWNTNPPTCEMISICLPGKRVVREMCKAIYTVFPFWSELTEIYFWLH